MSNKADLILFNGKIITVNQNFDIVEAVAIKDGKFIAVGTNEEVQFLGGENTDWIDLQGKTVIPGLIDSHMHVEMCAKQIDYVNLEKTREIEDVLQLIAERVRGTPPGETVMVGGPWHEKQLKEGRMVTRWDIDKVTPHHPVVILRGGHVVMCNSKALEMANISKNTPDPEHGMIVRNQDTGEPTGVLIESAKDLIDHLIPKITDEEMFENIHSFMAMQNSFGITGMTDAALTSKDIHIFRKVATTGNPTVRISGFIMVNSLEETKNAVSTYQPLEGNDFFRITSIKTMADGGVEGAWMKEPYQIVKGQQEDPKYRGVPFYPAEREDELRKMLEIVAQEGWQMQIHVAGDAATEQIIHLYEEVSKEYPIQNYRWTIMHVLGWATKDLQKLKEIGCLATVQDLSYLLGMNMIHYWGKERAAKAAPIRTMIDLNIPLGGGTDAPVVPWNPFKSIYWMVTRKIADGSTLGKEEAVTREEAIRLWTMGSAYTQFKEKTHGSIERGKFADLAVISDDLLTVPEEDIKNIVSELTIVNGKIVYQNRDSLTPVKRG